MKLSKEQREIVEANERLIVVSAGAGSGKTRVIEQRIRRMMNEGKDASEMAAITFTRTAAGVMRDRLGSDFKGYVGTLHSYIFQMIDRYREFTGKRRLRIADEQTVDYVFRYVKHNLRSTVSRQKFDKERINTRESRRITDEQRLVKAFETEMICCGLVDFDMILKLGVRMFDDIFPMMGHRYFFVDEYQDSGDLDNMFYDKIASVCSVMIVGDINQSIYAFRGGRPENMEEKINGGVWKHYRMTENYRSGREICDLANAIFENSATWVNGNGAMVNAKTRLDARFLHEVGTIRKLIEEGVQEDEIAVLLRTNFHVQCYREMLSSMGLKVRKTVAELPQGWKRMKTILSIYGCGWDVPDLQLAAYLDNEKDGIRDSVYRLVQESRKTQDTSKLVEQSKLPNSLQEFIAVANNFITAECTYWLRYVVAEGGGSCYEALQLLREIEQGFIRTEGGITVSTIHGSKGGEWDVVVLPEMNEDVFPKDTESLEELRLFYVAVTRARSLLIATCSDSHLSKWKHGCASPSPYFKYFLGGN